MEFKIDKQILGIKGIGDILLQIQFIIVYNSLVEDNGYF